MLDGVENRRTVPCDHEWIILRRRLDGLNVIACRRCGTVEARSDTPPDAPDVPSFDFRGYTEWKTNPHRP
jgi:hypothetical protein